MPRLRRIVLTVTPDKTVDEDKRAEFDREATVKFFLSLRIKPGSTEAEGNKVYFIFDRDEIKDAQNMMVSNCEVLVDYRDVVQANEIWQNVLGIFRDRRFELE
jgi:hypothetical protein